VGGEILARFERAGPGNRAPHPARRERHEAQDANPCPSDSIGGEDTPFQEESTGRLRNPSPSKVTNPYTTTRSAEGTTWMDCGVFAMTSPSTWMSRTGSVRISTRSTDHCRKAW